MADNLSAVAILTLVLRGVEQVKEGAKDIHVFGEELERLAKKASSAEKVAGKAGKGAKKGGKDALDAADDWKKYANAITAARKAEQDIAKSKVQASFPPSAIPTNKSAAQMTSPERQALLQANDAQSTSVIAEARKTENYLTNLRANSAKQNQKHLEQAHAAAVKENNSRIAGEKRVATERAKSNKEAISGIDRMGAAYDKRVAAEGKLDRQRRQSGQMSMSQWDKEFKAAEKASAANMGGIQNAARARYALYDVGRTATIAATAISAVGIAVATAFGSVESAFTNVERTLDSANPAKVTALRSELMQLTREIPQSFSDIAGIATLGNQLGIASDDVAGFTETIARFSAVTGVSAEEAAKSFGSMGEILGVLPSQYENLGSAIAYVARTSVATDAEVLSLTREIGQQATTAGFAAHEVIGLAGALGSLRVPPERSRGALTTYFQTLNKVVAEGGEKLELFASLVGRTGRQLSNDVVNGRGAEVFRDFAQALSEMNTVKATKTLGELGLANLRVADTFTRISQNINVYDSALAGATQSFEQGTELARQYALVMDDLATKWQLFLNGMMEAGAAVGATLAPAIMGVLGILTELLHKLSEFADTPTGRGIVLVAGAMSALTVVIAGLIATTALGAASFLAIKTALWDITGASVAADISLRSVTGSLLGLGASASGAAIGMKLLRTVLITTGVGAALVAAGVVIGGIVEQLDKLKPAAEQAKAAFGDVSALTDALKADTAAVKAGARAYGYIEGEITKTRTTTAQWAIDLKRATGSQEDLGYAADVTTRKIEEQTYAIGDHSKVVLADMLANNQAIQELFKITSASADSTLPQFDRKGFVSALVENDTKRAQKIIDDFKAANEKLDLGAGERYGTLRAVDVAQQALTEVSGALELASTAGQITDSVYQALGVSTANAADQQEYLADGANNAANALQVLRDAVAEAFAGVNAMSSMSQDFYNLAEGIYTSGGALTSFSEAGIKNLSNFQSAIVTTIAAGETMGVSATNSVAALFLRLQAMGVDTANLLAAVSSIPGLDTKSVVSSMQNLSPAAQELSVRLAGVQDAAKRSADALASKRAGSLAQSARTAAKEVRTLTDYANDLQGIFSRSFEIRFGSGQALDSITSGWNSIAKKTAEAREQIAEYNGELREISADRNIKKYWLSIADMYGDTLRAAKIREELADLDRKQAATQKKLAEAQEDTNKTLEGNSDAAIQNRADILNLVGGYQNYLQALAASGASQQTLASEAARLKQQFVAQATQAGYSRSQIDRYAASFDDMTTAIKNVPRDITVNANTNPAIQALNEFLARAAASKVTVPVSTPDMGALGWNAGNAYGQAWTQAVMANRHMITNRGQNVPGGVTYQFVYSNGSKSLPFFSKGGYTGGGNPSDIAGAVHKKEFVFSAPAVQNLGLQNLAYLHNLGKSGGSLRGGGSGTGGAGITDAQIDKLARAIAYYSKDPGIQAGAIAGAVGAVNARNYAQGRS